MKVKTKVKVDMAPVQHVMKRLGVTPDGKVIYYQAQPSSQSKDQEATIV